MAEAYYQDIVKQNYEKVFRLCFRHFANEEDAEDATQDVFLKIWLNKDRFRGESCISTWIYRIAVNVCLTHIRKRKTETVGKNFVRDHFISVADVFDSNSVENEKERYQFLEKFLTSIPAIDRTLINLYLENLDSRKISEITGLSDNNVRIRMHRIKKRLNSEWEVYHENK